MSTIRIDRLLGHKHRAIQKRLRRIAVAGQPTEQHLIAQIQRETTIAGGAIAGPVMGAVYSQVADATRSGAGRALPSLARWADSIERSVSWWAYRHGYVHHRPNASEVNALLRGAVPTSLGYRLGDHGHYPYLASTEFSWDVVERDDPARVLHALASYLRERGWFARAAAPAQLYALGAIANEVACRLARRGITDIIEQMNMAGLLPTPDDMPAPRGPGLTPDEDEWQPDI